MGKSGRAIDAGKTSEQDIGVPVAAPTIRPRAEQSTFPCVALTTCGTAMTVPVPRGHGDMKPEDATVQDHARCGAGLSRRLRS